MSSIHHEFDTWIPDRGADWKDLMGRAGRRGGATRSRWTVYSVASLSLAAILLAAFLFISLVDLGAIGGPVRALLP